MVKDQIKELLTDIIGEKEFSLDVSDNQAHGDYTTNIAMQMAAKTRKLKNSKNPKEFAEELVDKLKASEDLGKLVSKVEVAGPGFINFWLSDECLLSSLNELLSQKENYGESTQNEHKSAMVEYAHPNTHKQFHIGHLRNITTGESLCRLLEVTGQKVTRVNYQGDVGLHIAKALFGLKKLGSDFPTDLKGKIELLGNAYVEGNRAYEEDEHAKAEIVAINKELYEKGGESEIKKLYQETRSWSLEYFDSIYKRVGTKFDRLYFESEVAEKAKVVAGDALKKGVLTKGDKGAIVYEGENDGLHTRVFITGEGIPTYEAKDLALANLQLDEYKPDQIIHVVGPEQSAYFQVIFKVLSKLNPETEGKELHIPYGWVKLKDGKMSSRKGNVVLGTWLLDEVKKRIEDAHKMTDETAEIVAIGAVKYSFLKQGLTQEMSFDIAESMSIEGNSGPYLQYTHARARSILKNAKESRAISHMPKDVKAGPEELSLVRTFVHFPEVVETSAKSYSPNLLCNYLYQLSKEFNAFYNKNRIIDSENFELRLGLTSGAAQIIKNGLNLLGIQAPERM